MMESVEVKKSLLFKYKKKFLDFIDRNWFLSNLLLFLRIRDGRENIREYRTIYLNNVQPSFQDQKYQEPLKNYRSNSIKTSKYTLWNFLPKNLFEQFRRVANMYFLINLIIVLIVPDPATNPYLNIIPIAFVVLVTMAKQGYEDILRHVADNNINKLPTRIYRKGKFEDARWKDIKVGDIVEVGSDQPFPCDLLLLHSFTETNECFITTANLDGETNLKKRIVPQNFAKIEQDSDVENLRGIIECDKPNIHLYEFNGKVITGDKQIYILNENILLRGCFLKIAPRIIGCAIYTGQETKMMLNSKFKANKMSCIERKLNWFVVAFFGVLAVLTFSSFGASFAYDHFYVDVWYFSGISPSFFDSNRGVYHFTVLILYMNLYNYIVPLSLYVTMELQRFVGSQFIEWDLNMYDEITDQPAKANTSDLNEDLGQVEYLFSDKTGTLTENEMEFKQFSIDGEIYEQHKGTIRLIGSEQKLNLNNKNRFERMFQVLSLCHTVQVDRSMKEMYQASSPDEFSFLKFCSSVGVVYEGEAKDSSTQAMIRTVTDMGAKRDYELLQILEFDSNRRRMSVIVKDLSDNQILLLCKGAESSIFKCCTSGSDVSKCDADIKRFAEQGWRTLALAFKKLSKSEYEAVAEKIKSALGDLKNRNEAMAKVFDEVESGLELIGATAVEDKLQDGVPETLELLRQGGIKIWVLTGDKKETAINISNSCKHFSPQMIKLDFTDMSKVFHIRKRIDYFNKIIMNKKEEEFAFIVDGQTLAILFKYNSLIEEFRDLCMKCSAVLCCRMSPSQKAQIVKIVKRSKHNPITAAIGDGANDVSMIQEAHVGLGIFGKEGRNAARSADFAYAKFKYTKRILLVHGYLYYTRAATMVQYFFYKNLAFAICNFYYAFFNAFSVASLYDTIVLTLYNVFYTSVPILLFGLFEQKIPMEKLEKSPHLYRTITRNRILSKRNFLKWQLIAIWHSLVCFFFSYALYQPNTALASDGKMADSGLGALVATLTIVVVHLRLYIEWSYKSVAMLIGYALSIFFYIVFSLVLNSFIIPYPLILLFTDQTIYWTYFQTLSYGTVWLCIVLALTLSLVPDIITKIIENIRNKRSMQKSSRWLARKDSKPFVDSPDNYIQDPSMEMDERFMSSDETRPTAGSSENNEIIGKGSRRNVRPREAETISHL